MFDNTLTKGPGNVAKAMGISKNITGLIVGEKIINIYKDDFSFLQDEIGTSKRIGIDGAGTDAELPYRFFVRGNKFVSGRPVRWVCEIWDVNGWEMMVDGCKLWVESWW